MFLAQEGFDEVTILNTVPEVILNGVVMLEDVSESDSRARKWESGNYVMSRKSLTFFVQLGFNYTFRSQNCSALTVTYTFIPLKCV